MSVKGIIMEAVAAGREIVPKVIRKNSDLSTIQQNIVDNKKYFSMDKFMMLIV